MVAICLGLNVLKNVSELNNMLWPISVIWGVQLRASVLAIRIWKDITSNFFFKNSQKPAVSYPFPDPMYVAFLKQGFMVDVREAGSVIFKSSWTMPSRDHAEWITFQVRSRVDCATACINENACSGHDTDTPGCFILCHMAMGFSAAWWRHQMETMSALLAICAGNSPVSGEFPTQRPVTRIFDVFFDLRLSKRLSKQSWGWRLETLGRHSNENFLSYRHLRSQTYYFFIVSGILSMYHLTTV